MTDDSTGWWINELKTLGIYPKEIKSLDLNKLKELTESSKLVFLQEYKTSHR